MVTHIDIGGLRLSHGLFTTCRGTTTRTPSPCWDPVITVSTEPGALQYLPRGHKKRRKRHGRKVHSSKIPNRVSIHHRPEEINARTTFGHWEGDSVLGTKGIGDGIHTEVERHSRMLVATKVDTLTSQAGVDAQKRLFSPLPAHARRSTTMDNGTEMHLHTELVTDYGIATYFADPYSSWQRGTNEHHNGRLRRYYPKGTDFSQIPEDQLQAAITEINNQPRKCLEWFTPAVVFQEHLESEPTDQCCTSKQNSVEGFQELVWPPGTAQVDFGQAQALIAGVKMLLHILVVSFLYSNMRYVQAYRGETAECVCHGLRAIFEHIGTVPRQLIFDSATGIGRRTGKKVIESKLFGAFKVHYRCQARYCNPYSGHEKGNVENAVGFLNRNVMVPEPEAQSIEGLNQILLARCAQLAEAEHYRKGVPISELFAEDIVVGLQLPGIGWAFQ